MAARVYDEVFGYIEDATKTLPGAAAPGELPGELVDDKKYKIMYKHFKSNIILVKKYKFTHKKGPITGPMSTNVEIVRQTFTISGRSIVT